MNKVDLLKSHDSRLSNRGEGDGQKQKTHKSGEQSKTWEEGAGGSQHYRRRARPKRWTELGVGDLCGGTAGERSDERTLGGRQ